MVAQCVQAFRGAHHAAMEWLDARRNVANPRAVKTWHAKLSKTVPTTADHCARLIRACYREEARLDRTLNPAASPTSGIRLGKIKVSKAVLDFPDFSAWRKAWDKIENPVHKGYHLAALLTGCRPTELAMIRESDIDLDARRMIIRNAKAGNDISLPITGEIAFALAMAINAPPQTITMKGLRGMRSGEVRVVERKKLHHEIAAPDLVFPGVRQAGHRSGLPVSGNALRHTFRSIAVSLEISEMLISFLMGHSLQGVSAKYTNELMIANSESLRTAQEKISRRIFELLALAPGAHDAPLVPGRAEPGFSDPRKEQGSRAGLRSARRLHRLDVIRIPVGRAPFLQCRRDSGQFVYVVASYR